MMDAKYVGKIFIRLLEIKRNQFVKNLTMYGSSASFAQGLMMIYTLLVARFLGPELFGIFAGCYAATSLSSFFISWGMDTWQLREASRGHSSIALGSAVLRTKLITGAIWSAALLFILPAIKPEIFLSQLLFIVILDVWSDSGLNTLLSVLNVQKRLVLVSRLMLFSRGGRLVGALTVILIGVHTPFLFALSRLLFTFSAFIVAILLLRPNPFRTSFAPTLQILRRSMNFGISEFLAMVYIQVDITMLTLLAAKSAVGIYSAAAGLVNALFILPNAVYFVAIPVLSRMVEQNDPQFQNVSKRLMAGFLLLGIIMTLVVSLPGQWIILAVLGPEYQETSSLLVILSAVLLLKSLGFGLASILIAVNWQQKRLLPQAFSAMVNILLNLIAIPFFGVKGVAIVYIISEAFLLLGYSYLVIRLFKQRRQGVLVG